MPRALWPLVNDRPSIQVILTDAKTGQREGRMLLADTGAGRAISDFDLILPRSDCLLAGGKHTHNVVLAGAVAGNFPCYVVQVRIPVIGFDDAVFAVGVPGVADDLDGIACFAFLNRFTYGNFGKPSLFGLEM